MKRYLVFAGDEYYPLGGWSDFRESFDSWDEAVLYTANCGGDWWQIVDSLEGNTVKAQGYR